MPKGRLGPGSPTSRWDVRELVAEQQAWLVRGSSLQKAASSRAQPPLPLPLAPVRLGRLQRVPRGDLLLLTCYTAPLRLFCKRTSHGDERAFLMLPASSISWFGSLHPLNFCVVSGCPFFHAQRGSRKPRVFTHCKKAV